MGGGGGVPPWSIPARGATWAPRIHCPELCMLGVAWRVFLHSAARFVFVCGACSLPSSASLGRGTDLISCYAASRDFNVFCAVLRVTVARRHTQAQLSNGCNRRSAARSRGRLRATRPPVPLRADSEA